MCSALLCMYAHTSVAQLQLKAMTLLSAGLCYIGLCTKDTKTGLAGMAPYTAAHTAQESRLRGV